MFLQHWISLWHLSPPQRALFRARAETNKELERVKNENPGGRREGRFKLNNGPKEKLQTLKRKLFFSRNFNTNSTSYTSCK